MSWETCPTDLPPGGQASHLISSTAEPVVLIYGDLFLIAPAATGRGGGIMTVITGR